MAEEVKVVVTNMRALRSKYGHQLARVKKALNALIVADGQRGLTTRIVALDDRDEMAKLHAPAVDSAGHPAQAKAAIDGVFVALQPSYLMILGAIDVVPHQPLSNPKYSSKDSNRTAHSDLPYACAAPYSTEIGDFTGPTRSVGRLPDVTGHGNPGYLVGLLHSAASGVPQAPPDGSGCLGISAQTWLQSTSKTLKEVFGSETLVHPSPGEGPNWPGALLARPIHFINCHGGKSDCRFYGESDSGEQDDYDLVAHDSGCVARRLTPGTVAAVECCYGAQLYDPADAAGVLGICNTYLASGAHAFFGSSTVAYGGDRFGESADVMCQYFLQRLLEGHPAGDAALGARVDFVRQNDLDLVNLKTLAQFSLMGDPSLQPFLSVGTHAAEEHVSAAAGAPDLARRAAQRAEHRASLAAEGEDLRRSTAVAHRATQVPDAPGTIKRILDFASMTGWGRPELKSFVKSPQDSPPDEHTPAGPWLVHVITRPGRKRTAPFSVIELIVATEVEGKIVSFRHVLSR